jgi:hypothetical protein
MEMCKKNITLLILLKLLKIILILFINTYLIDEKQNNIISGVNTPEELFKLELSF